MIIPYKESNKWGIVDEDFTSIIPCEYQNVKLCKSLDLIYQHESLWGIINKNGSIITKAIYETIVYEEAFWENEGFFKVCENGLWGIASRNFTVILPTIYEKIDIYMLEEDKIFFGQKLKGLWGIQEYGNLSRSIEPEYDELELSELWDYFIAIKDGTTYKFDHDLKNITY